MAGSQGPQSIQEGYRALLADIAALAVLPDADPKFLMTLQAAIVQKARMGNAPPGARPGPGGGPGGPPPPGAAPGPGGPGMPGNAPGGGAANPAMPTMGAPTPPGTVPGGAGPGAGVTGMNSPDEIRRVIAANQSP